MINYLCISEISNLYNVVIHDSLGTHLVINYLEIIKHF